MTASPRPPNVLLLVLDSVRAANVSCYGYERPTTPNLDELASQSTLFEQAISVGCWTLPVHASLFTGLYPLNHGLTRSRDALPEGFPTLARRLGEHGYRTACFSSNPYISRATGLTQGFETVSEVWETIQPRGTAKPRSARRLEQLQQQGALGRAALPLARTLRRTRSRVHTWRRGRSDDDRGARLINERIAAWLRAANDDARPFFIFANYMEGHERYAPPSPYNGRFMPGRFSSWRVAQVGNKAEVLRRSSTRRADDLEILRGLYDGSVAYLDDRVGELIRDVESLALLDDTVVIVASDHGDSLGEHDHLGHRLYLYDQLVHVPLLIRYPARFAPGTRRSEQVELASLHPTILELAGADGPAEGESRSSWAFRSLLEPLESASVQEAIAENTAPKSLEGTQMRMLRSGRRKYIWKSNGDHELYDLRTDPGELENLVGVEVELAHRMRERLEAWASALAGKDLDTREAAYDEEVLERLRDLGYLE